eukprot:PhM_4_TR18510/c0_g1_i2/m.5567
MICLMALTFVAVIAIAVMVMTGTGPIGKLLAAIQSFKNDNNSNSKKGANGPSSAGESNNKQRQKRRPRDLASLPTIAKIKTPGRRRVVAPSSETRIDELRAAIDQLQKEENEGKQKTPDSVQVRTARIRSMVAQIHSRRGSLPHTQLAICISTTVGGAPDPYFRDLCSSTMSKFTFMTLTFDAERSGAPFMPTVSNIRFLIGELNLLYRDWSSIVVYFRGTVRVSVDPTDVYADDDSEEAKRDPYTVTDDLLLAMAPEFEGPEAEELSTRELISRLSSVGASASRRVGAVLPYISVFIDAQNDLAPTVARVGKQQGSETTKVTLASLAVTEQLNASVVVSAGGRNACACSLVDGGREVLKGDPSISLGGDESGLAGGFSPTMAAGFAPPPVSGDVDTSIAHCGDVSVESVVAYATGTRLFQLEVAQTNSLTQLTPFATQRSLRPYNCPPTPLRTIHREEVEDTLRGLVLSNPRDVGTVVVVHGTRGIGKSVAVLSGVCWDRGVVGTFGLEGVFYMDLNGIDNSLMACVEMTRVAQLMTGTEARFGTLTAAKEFFAYRADVLKSGGKMPPVVVVDNVNEPPQQQLVNSIVHAMVGAVKLVIVCRDMDMVISSLPSAVQARTAEIPPWGPNSEATILFLSKVCNVNAGRMPDNLRSSPMLMKLLAPSALKSALDLTTTDVAKTKLWSDALMLAWSNRPMTSRTRLVVAILALFAPSELCTQSDSWLSLSGVLRLVAALATNSSDSKRHQLQPHALRRELATVLLRIGWIEWRDDSVRLSTALVPMARDVVRMFNDEQGTDSIPLSALIVDNYRTLYTVADDTNDKTGNAPVRPWWHHVPDDGVFHEHVAALVAPEERRRMLKDHEWLVWRLRKGQVVRVSGDAPAMLTPTAVAMILRSPWEAKTQLSLTHSSRDDFSSVTPLERAQPLSWGTVPKLQLGDVWCRKYAEACLEEGCAPITAMLVLSGAVKRFPAWSRDGAVDTILVCGHDNGGVSVFDAADLSLVRRYESVHDDGATVTDVMERPADNDDEEDGGVDMVVTGSRSNRHVVLWDLVNDTRTSVEKLSAPKKSKKTNSSNNENEEENDTSCLSLALGLHGVEGSETIALKQHKSGCGRGDVVIVRVADEALEDACHRVDFHGARHSCTCVATVSYPLEMDKSAPIVCSVLGRGSSKTVLMFVSLVSGALHGFEVVVG